MLCFICAVAAAWRLKHLQPQIEQVPALAARAGAKIMNGKFQYHFHLKIAWELISIYFDQQRGKFTMMMMSRQKKKKKGWHVRIIKWM